MRGDVVFGIDGERCHVGFLLLPLVISGRDIHHSGANQRQVKLNILRRKCSKWNEPGAGIAGSGVEIIAGRGHRTVAKSGLNQMNRRAVV